MTPHAIKSLFSRVTGQAPGAYWLRAHQQARSIPYRAVATFNRLTGNEPSQRIAVFGCPRSGTTWVAEQLLGPGKAPMLWEPLNVAMTPEPARLGFSLLSCLGPHHADAGKVQYVRDVFAARRLTHYLAQATSVGSLLRPRTVLVKFTNGNTVLPWFVKHFPDVPTVLVLRHPAAVVASILRHPNWNEYRLHSIRRALENPDILHRFPALATCPLEDHAALLAAYWAVSNLVPLANTSKTQCFRVSYEQLFDRPEAFAGLAGRLGLEWTQGTKDPRAASYSSRASDIARASTRWIDDLSGAERRVIEATVERFGFGTIFRTDRPTAEDYCSLALPAVELR